MVWAQGIEIGKHQASHALWMDWIYGKAGPEKDRAECGGLGTLSDLKRRGVAHPRLVTGDGHQRIWGSLGDVYPRSPSSSTAGATRCSKCWTSCRDGFTPAAKPLLGRIV